MSSTYKYFNGLPSGIEGDGGLKNWFNGLPAQPLLAASAQTLTPSLFSDTDTFFAPTLGGQSTVAPALVDDTDTFYQPTVAPGAITLTPSLFNDSDAYYAPIINVVDYPLTPPLFTVTDSFYAPTVKFDQFLTPGIYTDSDSFYAPTVDPRFALTPSLFSDTDTFYQPTVAAGAVTLTPSLFTDTDTFYVPGEAATSTLTPALFSDTDTFYSPSLSGRGAVLPGFVDESAVVYPAAVSSTYALAAPLVTDADSIPRPAVTNGYPLNPALYTDTDTFYAPPTIARGPVTVRPSRYIDADVFYTAAVQLQSTQGGGGGGSNSIPANVKYATQFTMATSGLITALQVQANSANTTVQTRMMLYADSAGLPGALLAQSNAKTGVAVGTNSYALITPYAVLAGQKVWVTIHTNNALAVLGNTKSGARYNTDTFSDGPTDPFGPSSLDNKKAPVLLVLLSAANASVLPTLYSDSDTFYSPALSERNTLVPPLHSEPDFFYAPRLGLNLQPGIFGDDTFYSPAVAPGAVALQPTLVPSDDAVSSPDVAAFSPTIFPPYLGADDNFVLGDGVNVTPEGAHLLPGAYADSDAFYVPVVLDSYQVSSVGLLFGDTFYVPTVGRGAVTLRPGLVAAGDQFWLEAVVQGVGTRNVQPGLVASDDVFYTPNRGTGPLVRRTVNIKGSTKLSTKALSGSTANGVNLVGDDSKVKIDMEGNDA